MSAIGLLYQPYKPETRAMAESCLEFITRDGHEGQIRSAFDLELPVPDDLNLAITFGGDGTTLRAARWLSATEVPILPVRMGTLSFLGELSPGELFDRLGPYLEGEFWVDERAMLSAELDGQKIHALNDVVVARGGGLRAIHVDVSVDGEHVTRYTADGLIIATATGSTAYSLAAGGPILAPDLRCMVVTPIAPHLSVLHSLVVGEGARVSLMPAPGQAAEVTVDGQHDIPVRHGEQVHVTVSKRRARFARRGARTDFYRSIAAKLCRE